MLLCTGDETKNSVEKINQPKTGVGQTRKLTKECASQPQAWFESYEASELASMQKKDDDISPVYKALEVNKRPEVSEMVTQSSASRHYWILWGTLVLCRGVLCRQFSKRNATGNNPQMIVPQKLKPGILKRAHSNILAGHLGTKKTKYRFLQNYYWFNLGNDIKLFVRACCTYASDSIPRKKARAPMGHLPSRAPWDTLSIDYMGPLPITENGNKYIMVLADHFTKYVEIIPVPSQQADLCALKVGGD